jgi:hypothetical protein
VANGIRRTVRELSNVRLPLSEGKCPLVSQKFRFFQKRKSHTNSRYRGVIVCESVGAFGFRSHSTIVQSGCSLVVLSI